MWAAPPLCPQSQNVQFSTFRIQNDQLPKCPGGLCCPIGSFPEHSAPLIAGFWLALSLKHRRTSSVCGATVQVTPSAHASAEQQPRQTRNVSHEDLLDWSLLFLLLLLKRTRGSPLRVVFLAAGTRTTESIPSSSSSTRQQREEGPLPREDHCPLLTLTREACVQHKGAKSERNC